MGTGGCFQRVKWSISKRKLGRETEVETQLPPIFQYRGIFLRRNRLH
jgi:hypothetical protein